ncbi:membrane fusion protein (multidrug efflux system) [Erwinia toletana]|uniref:Membrane fusion protein (Multidrug efflux system) n=1 Tax=Winslowiella toletana TaxID=92490 RepID=A0ABS4P655_9GAMM|nr:efflux RND transporter periplasmic adaptor subunit [Winslowiella toletana]MBP2168126.1 membrane fusion protein (multidrug efflux system) [Winslowiella toletana]
MQLKFLSASVIFLLAACDQSSAPATSNPVTEVGVVTLQAEPVTLMTQLPGRTTAVRSAEVRPQVSGIITQRLFTEGGEVTAGQPLYQIDAASYQAAYDKAQATLTNASMLAKRYKPLAAAHAISGQSYDDAVAAAKEAQADLETARVNLNYTRVRAPISGHIGRSLSTEGALVTDGQSSYLTTIQQLDPIYVDVSESSQDLLRQRRALANGQLTAAGDNAAAVKLTLEDGSAYAQQGKLEFSEVTVNESTGTVTMRASFPNPHNELLPGMFVHASFPQGIAAQGLLVPQQAIGHDVKGKPYVYVVNADSTVAQRTVTTGEMMQDKWLVTAGLQAGEKVVVSGLQSIRSGVKVDARESDLSSTRSAANLTTTDASAQ